MLAVFTVLVTSTYHFLARESTYGDSSYPLAPQTTSPSSTTMIYAPDYSAYTRCTVLEALRGLQTEGLAR